MRLFQKKTPPDRASVRINKTTAINEKRLTVEVFDKVLPCVTTGFFGIKDV